MQDIPLLLDSKQYFFISHMISPSFSSTPFQNFPGVSDLLPEASNISGCKYGHLQRKETRTPVAMSGFKSLVLLAIVKVKIER
jgi:hypothetical protein